MPEPVQAREVSNDRKAAKGWRGRERERERQPEYMPYPPLATDSRPARPLPLPPASKRSLWLPV